MPGGGLARMRGGPRQIQDSQRGEGGGVINKSAHKEGGWGYPIFYFCFIFKQILSELSGRTVHVLQAS